MFVVLLVTGLHSEPKHEQGTDARKSAPVGIRTPNLLIRSQMLYPLSYGRLPLMGLGNSSRW